MTPEELSASVAKVLDSNPDLGAAGIMHPGYLRQYPDINPGAQRAEFNTDYGLAQIAACLDWYGRAHVNQRVSDRSPGSYGIKHVIEAASGLYIPNGAAIVGALILGLPTKRWPDSPNVSVGLNRRWYDAERAARGNPV